VDEDTEGYGYNWITVVDWKIRVPEIAIATNYGKVPYVKVKLTRKNILIRDNFKCMYTGERVTMHNMTIDHVIPRGQGGKTEWTNLVVSSQKANVRKANRTPDQAGMKLLRKPVEPKWHPLFAFAVNKVRKSWEPYINTDKWNELGYWDVELQD
jgi:5-methylcytosine-specific restriction endonuclease McrA